MYSDAMIEAMTDQDKTDLGKNDDPSAAEPASEVPVASSEPAGVEIKIESIAIENGVVDVKEVVIQDGAIEVKEAIEGSSFDVEATIADIKKQIEAEPYAPKRPPLNPVAVMMNLLAMMMFVGGTGVSLMLVARSFELHGNILVAYVVVSAAAVLGMAGSFLCKILGDAERWLAGAVFGACLGAMSALIFYGQTRNYPWWQ